MCNSNKKPYYEALPASLKPYHYDLSISDINVEKETFKGKVVIYFTIVEETKELHLNYRDLSVSQDKINIVLQCNDSTKDIGVTSIEEFKEKEYFIIKFDETVKPMNNSKLIVTLNFDAIIQTNMAGFYKSGYKESGVEKIMLSTQFEATDARRAFPCLDEPALKATFSVDLIVSQEWTTLGNMPIFEEKSIGSNLKTVKFEKTPIMSTYLLAWACGEFEYIESFTDGVYQNDKPLPVRIYTTKGYKEEAKLASEIAPKIIDYFSKIFEIKYPLPKLDLIAVHSFSHNAMENWGLVTYRSTALLYSETKSDPSYKQKVAYVVAHELAHQWFGNLVTMKWWDELWLNEGFATWVGFAAVDYLFPEWDIFSGFVSESLQQALNLDGLRNSHPIEVPVVDALDIDQVFDAISYLKGASTILMISNSLGTEIFLKGVANYLNKNKFSNATSHDLWSSISEVSGRPVNEMMESWIKKIGFPIVNVDLNSAAKQLTIKQSRFLNSGDLKDEENHTKWWIPLNISNGPSVGDKLSLDPNEFSPGSSNVTINDFPLTNDFFKLNKDTAGVYRVNYSPQVMEHNILPFFNKLSGKDKVGIIADVASIAVSGDRFTSTTTLLKLIKSVIDSDSIGDEYVVWLELGKRLDNILVSFTGMDERVSIGLKNFAKSVYEKVSIKFLNELEKNKIDDSQFLRTKLRAEILGKSGLLSITESEDYALRLFNEWKSGKPIHPSLRAFVFSTIVSSKRLIDSEKFGLILHEVTHPTSLDSREIALESLGHINDKELSQKLIGYLINPDIVPTMDSHFLGRSLSTNASTKDEFWKFFKENYDEFYKLMSTNMVVLDRFIKLTLGKYQSMAMYNEIKNFFSLKDVHGFERSYKQVLDNILINSSWVERDLNEVKEWLQANGYIN